MSSCSTKDNCQKLDKENILKNIASEVLGYHTSVYIQNLLATIKTDTTSPTKIKLDIVQKCIMSCVPE